MEIFLNPLPLFVKLGRAISPMVESYEIHCYHEDTFQYVVARTNKWSEEKVKTDVQRMNNMLSSELKIKGIRYVFAETVERHGHAGNRWSKNERRKTSGPEFSAR